MEEEAEQIQSVTETLLTVAAFEDGGDHKPENVGASRS